MVETLNSISEKPWALWFRTLIFPALLSAASWFCVYLFTDFNHKIDNIVAAQHETHESLSVLNLQLKQGTKEAADGLTILGKQVNDHEIRLRVLEGDTRGHRR